MSTLTSRRVVVENPHGEYLTHIRTRGHGVLPLTNPGHFAHGTYLAVVHEAEGTATILASEGGSE
jgi:hypothetical protein